MAHDSDHGHDTSSAIPVETYSGIIRDAIKPLVPSRLDLSDAEGCVLAEDVTAAVSLPSFDNSGMDGYAVMAADIASASADSPVVLPVAGEIAAGDIGAYRLVPGTAMKIMTGAQLPADADAVVPVEWTDGGDVRVSVSRPAPSGNAVRYVGGDAVAGEVLLSAGVRLRPMHIAVAASAGRGALSVRPRPRVVILSTGDELAEPGTPLVPGRIWDSNSYMIAALAREAGAVAYRHSGLPDDIGGVLPAITEQLIRADMVITTGGVSMGGTHDVVKAALSELGTVQFRKIAMQPGMPQGFGLIGPDSVPIFTLPGNPVSAYVSFQLFVRPALGLLQGTDDLRLPTVSATLGAPVRSPAGRRSYLRAVLAGGSGRGGSRGFGGLSGVGGFGAAAFGAAAFGAAGADGGKVTPLSGQESHQIASLGRANALIIVPESQRELPEGETVEVIVLP